MRSIQWLLAGAVGMALLPHAAPAQSAAAWRDSAQRLHAQVIALRDSIFRGDSTAREVARHGDFVIAASAGNQAAATEALQRFVEFADRWFGGAMPAAGGFRIVIRTERPTSADTGSHAGVIVLSGLPDTVAALRDERKTSVSEVSNTLIDTYSAMMFASVAVPSLWLNMTPNLTKPQSEQRQVAMYSLITGTGPAQRGCITGDVAACAYALELRRPPVANSAPVFPLTMRADLVLTALSTGGNGAWARFRASGDSAVATALAAAAAMPLDSLLARWRTGLLALRPTDGPLTVRLGLAALLWSAAALLGAMGASRWA